jgi:FixJ family two-component response regulator
MNQEKVVAAIIDDDEGLRKALVRLVENACDEVHAFASARDFIESNSFGKVSCVVSDLRMPDLDGLQLQQIIAHRLPWTSVVFITGYGDIPSSVTAMKAGAVDFFEKPINSALLLDAVCRAVARSQALRAVGTEDRSLRDRYDKLTPRERQVMALVTTGLLNKQIGAELGAAEGTIKQHRGRVMAKMRADSLADLTLMADRLGVRLSGMDFWKAKGHTHEMH